MKIYKKIFMIFFGVIAITTKSVAKTVICNENFYVELCNNIAITPANVFWILYYYTYTNNNETPKVGLACFDFENDTNNFENMRRFFHPEDYFLPMTCYLMEPNDIYNSYNSKINPQDPISVPVFSTAGGFVYLDSYKYIVAYCVSNLNSIRCAPCPNGGRTEESYFTSHEDFKFFTMADCYSPSSTHTDNTGTFEYTNGDNKCYYSGE